MSGYFEEMGWRPLENGQAPNHLLHLAQLLRDCGMWDLLAQHEKLPPPASKAAVEALEDVKITGEQSKQCPVCLKAFEADDMSKALPCRHCFHKECIIPWLEKTNSCPLCRHELPTDDEVYEMYRKEKKRAVEREKDIEALHDSMFS